MRQIRRDIEKGNSIITVSGFETWPAEIYTIKVTVGNEYFVNEMILKK